jgi:hypothetical protein
MPDPTDQDSLISGADDSAEGSSPPSLREIAEKAYDEGSRPEREAPTDDGGRARDDRGRFAPKESKTGEAEREAPSPEPKAETPVPTDPALSNRAPDHWSAQDKAVFDRSPPEVKEMLQRRYSEMEADYTRKSQANASAVQAVNALAPIFNDPDIQRSLASLNVHPVGAIQQWASFHKRAVSPNVQDRAALMIDLAEQMGFDPARLFAVNRPPEPQLPPGVADDPAIRHFANLYGKTASEMQSLRNQLQNIQATEQKKYEQETLKVARWNIDQWADEKGPDGIKLRADFNDQLPYLLKLFQADPNYDLAEAYDIARSMNPKTRGAALAAERARMQSQQSVAKAQAANRGNLRGVTSPVSKPTARTGNGGLRDVLDASADEVGF